MKVDDAAIEQATAGLRRARSVLVITGAGVSAESGIPTYRGVGGLYEVDTKPDGFAIEEILSATMLAENPALCWKYLAQIGLAVQGATHNRAHEIIAQWESRFERLWVLTQNVDGFHKSAGSTKLIEAHGNMYSLSCTKCDFTTTLEGFDGVAIPPSCPDCNGLVRPDVVLFGELIDTPGLVDLREQLELGFDVVLSVGTTSVFPYIRAPIELAKESGKLTIEINPCETEVSDLVDCRIQLPASDALARLNARIGL